MLSLKDNDIIHSASTKHGSSGSPIIRWSDDYYIIGLHYGGIKKENNIDYSFNLATSFDSILNNINKPNKIIEQEKMKQNKLNILFNIGSFPDIMNLINDIDNDNYNNKINNIIHYDSNINFSNNINQEIDDFEKVIYGAFIICTNMHSFNLIRAEILFKNKKSKRWNFNLRNFNRNWFR